MTGWLRGLWRGGVPAEVRGRLDPDENVLAVAIVGGGGRLVGTSWGLWLPEEDGMRRLGWHLVSKVTWGDGVLSVVESVECGAAGEAVLITDLPAREFVLDKAGQLPRVVHQRVSGSIKSRHHHALPGGGAWFVQRKVPGRDGLVLQVRLDPGADPAGVDVLAATVADRLREVE